MEKNNLSYDFEIIMVLRNLTDRFKQQGLKIDSSYLDYFGNQCPKCKVEMKVYNSIVKGIGSLSSYIILEQKKAVVYPLCKSCAKKLTSWNYNQEEDKNVEEFINSKLPDLKRQVVSESEESEKRKTEYKIFKKLIDD